MLRSLLSFSLRGWENVGAIYDGATSYCAAGSSYFGPCISEAASFDGKSDAAKARWSASCQERFFLSSAS